MGFVNSATGDEGHVMTPAGQGKAEVATFYDQFSKKLLRDYVHGNPRLDAAIARVCSHIDSSVKLVLDLGCGIGASSSAYKAARPWIQVDGIDLSPINVQTAGKLFSAPGLTFRVADVCESPVSVDYDLIALIDVYEHIQRGEWPGFNKVLAKRLAANGTIVLTLPSALHQRHLADHCPDGLQIIDETVTFQDVAQLASDVHCTVVEYQHVSIWNTNDYVHAVLQRNPTYQPLDRGRAATSFLPRLWQWLVRSHDRDISARKEHVRAKLGLSID